MDKRINHAGGRVIKSRYKSVLSRSILAGTTLLAVVAMLGGCASKGAPTGHRQYNKPKPPIKKSVGSYRVRKGDSLYSIAWRAGLDYQTVARWNGLRSPYTIYPGQLIRLSPPKKAKKSHATSGKTPKKTTSAPPAKSNKGTVNRGKKQQPSQPARMKKPPSKATGKLHWLWPTKGRILSQYSSAHSSRSGIRIGGRRGQRVVAAEAGEVVYVGSGLIGYGQLIIIKHNNKYLSAYGHNGKLLVKEGDTVKKGQHISDMGVTNQGKALLYFEVRRYGKPVNPLPYLPRG